MRATASSSALWLAATAVEGLLVGCSGGASQGSSVVTVDVPTQPALSAPAEDATPPEVHHAQPQTTAVADRGCCMGRNACKGTGGCKIAGINECKGLNDCKGKGGCKSGHCDESLLANPPPLPIIPLPAGSARASCSAKGTCRGNAAPSCCKGLNDCKGRGNCKVESDHDCAGKNDCKGKGGCKPSTC